MRTAAIAYLAASFGAVIGFIFGAAVRVGKESDRYAAKRNNQTRDL